jgi:hypothetical protein
MKPEYRSRLAAYAIIALAVVAGAAALLKG